MGLDVIIEAPKTGLLEKPENLIRELDAKSKGTLARKVEEIAGQVKGTSIDWRVRLQEELSGDEQGEIREAFSGSGVEKVFSKGMTAQEKMIESGKSELAKVIPGGEAAVNQIQQISSYGEKFSAAMDTAGKLFNEGKWMAAIGVIFSGLFGNFNLDEWNKNGKSEDKTKTGRSLDSVQEKNEYKYIAGISLLLKLEKITDKFSNDGITINPDINAVFLNKGFYIHTFEKLVSMKQKDGIGKALQVSGNEENIFKTIELLRTREDVLDKILSQDKPNWRKMSIYDIMLCLEKYSTFYGDIKNVNFEDLFKKGSDFITFNFQTNNGPLNHILDQEIKNVKSPFYGISKEYLARIFAIPKGGSFDKDTLSMGFEGDNYTLFLDKFIEFKNKLPFMLGDSFFAGKNDDGTKKDFKKFFEKEHIFSPGEILEFFTITGGNLDSSSYDRVKRSMIFTKVLFMLNEKPDLQGDTYLYALKEWGVWSSSGIEIPQEVKSSIEFMFRTMIEKTLNSTWGMAQRLWGMLDITERGVGIGAAVGMLIVIGGILRFTSAGLWASRGAFAASILATGIGGFTISQIYNYLEEKHAKEFAELKKSYNINSSQDFGNKLLNS